MELAIRTAMTTLGGTLLEQLLAVDTGHRGPRIDCGAGHQGEFVSYRSKMIDTVLGPIRVDRAYYHCAPCGRGVLPKDDELGLTGGSLSPGLRAMVARTGAAAPFVKASTLLSELAGITLTTKRVERSAEADGQQLAARIDTEAAAILNGQLVPLAATTPVATLYIAVDGTGVPMVAAETTGRAGKAADGRAHTREVKLGVLFTQTNVDEKGRPVRDPGSSSYLATLEPVEQFGSLVYAEARRRGSHHAQQLVVLGDGAPWIWNLASKHVHALGALVAPTLGEDAPGWLTDRLSDLDRGDIDALVAPSSHPPSASMPTAGSPRWLPRRSTRRSATSRPTPNGCATRTSAAAATSLDPAPSKPAAKPSPANASNSPECTGTYVAPPGAKKRPALPGATSTHQSRRTPERGGP